MSTNVTINEETTKVVQITTPGPPGPPLAGVTSTDSSITFDKTLKITTLDSPTGTLSFTGDNFASFGNIATSIRNSSTFQARTSPERRPSRLEKDRVKG